MSDEASPIDNPALSRLLELRNTGVRIEISPHASQPYQVRIERNFDAAQWAERESACKAAKLLRVGDIVLVDGRPMEVVSTMDHSSGAITIVMKEAVPRPVYPFQSGGIGLILDRMPRHE